MNNADTVGKPHNWRVIGLTLWAAAVAMQSLWWFQVQDVIPMVLVIVGGIIGINLFLRREILSRYPISASMMLGYSTYYFLLPPIATLLEGKPLTNNLDHPILVLLHAFVSFLFLLGAHAIYRNWNLCHDLRWLVADRVYKPLGFFRAPSNAHLLAMGIIGLMATYQQMFVGGGVQQELLGAGNKFMQALFVLGYLPFVMLVRGAMGENTGISRKWLWTIVGYTFLLLMLSIARNSRTAFLQGLASIGLVHFYGLSIRLFGTRIISVKKLGLAVVGIAILIGPITDMAISMVIVRRERADISSLELVRQTLNTFWDKEAIESYRRSERGYYSDWDEHYVDNLFLARLVNLKFADNSIDLALAMSDSDRRRFRDLELQRSLSILPRPILTGLGLSVDKDFLGGSSPMDQMLYMVTGNHFVLGAHRAGSILGNSYALFGWGYPFVLATLSLLLFPVADSLTSRIAVARRAYVRTEWSPILAPMAIIGFFGWFSSFSSAARGIDSTVGITDYLLRGWVQVLVVYAFAYWITLFAVKPFSKLSG